MDLGLVIGLGLGMVIWHLVIGPAFKESADEKLEALEAFVNDPNTYK